VSRFVELRPGEYRRTALLFLYFFLVVASFYILKPVRNALFLDALGAAKLPYVYLGTTALVALAMPLYTRAAATLSPQRLAAYGMGLSVLCILAFRWALGLGSTGVAAGFYIWVNLFSSVAIFQFWYLANVAFNAREAKRLFGFISSGGILGGAVGSAFTRWASLSLGTDALLTLSVVPLVACVIIATRLRVATEEPATEPTTDDTDVGAGGLRLIWESRYLKLIAATLGIATVVSTLVDYQFSVIAEERFPTTDEKTAFFGNFFAGLNGFVFLFQLVVTGRIVKRFGIGVSLLILPVAMAVGSVGVLAAPVLAAAVVVKGFDWGLRYSINQSTRELLYLPIQRATKAKAKPWIDIFGSRLAEGVAAVVLLGMTATAVSSIRAIGVVAVAFTVLWVIVVVGVKREYLRLLVGLLERRDVHSEDELLSALDASTVDVLRHALRVDDEARVIYALDLLRLAKGVDLSVEVRPLLSHASETVRAAAVRMLADIGDGSVVEEVGRLAESDKTEVQLEAVYYVCRYGPVLPEEQMREFWHHADPTVRAAAIACVARHGNDIEVGMAYEGIRQIIDDKGADNADVRFAVAKAFASMDAPALTELLEELVADLDPHVAAQAIESAGHLGAPALVPAIEARLRDAPTAVAARAALASYGDAIVPRLRDALLGEGSDPRVRRGIPRVLCMVGTDEAAGALVEALGAYPADLAQDTQELRYHAIKALNRLRRNRADTVVPESPLAAAIESESRLQVELLDHRDVVDSLGEPASLLSTVLHERQEQGLERLFRLLALRHPPRDIYNAYAPLRAPRRSAPRSAARSALRPNALELLDNLLPTDTKRLVMPLIEDGDSDARLRPLRQRWGLTRHSATENLGALLHADDAWLSAAAARAVALLHDAPSAPLVPPGVPPERLAALADALPERTPDMNLLEKVEFLTRAELFGDINTEQLGQAAAATTEADFDAGAAVFREFEYADSVYVVVQGEVRLSGETIPDHVAGEGEVFGMLALFADEARLLTAVATQPTQTLRLDKDVFLDLLADHVEISRGMLSNLTQKIQTLSAELQKQRKLPPS
jgi:ATP:ADP antiporter, AAA family